MHLSKDGGQLRKGELVNKKAILIPLVILAALGLVFLARNRFSADAPKKNGKGEVSENGNQNGGSNGTPEKGTTSTEPLLRYQAPPGIVRLYEVSMVTTINLVLDLSLQPGQPPQTQTETLRLVGNLECSGYQSPQKDLLLLGCTFKEVSIETDQIPLDATMRKFVSEQLRDEFFFTMFRMHRWLLFDSAIGRPIVGIATIIFLFLSISGVVLWFPKKKIRNSNILPTFKTLWDRCVSITVLDPSDGFALRVNRKIFKKPMKLLVRFWKN